MVKLTLWRALSFEYEGRKVRASYAYLPDEKVIRVKTPKGEKATTLRNSTPVNLARMLLIKMAREGKA